MKPENEPTPKSRNRLTTGISAAIGAGALIATGLGVVGNIDAPKPKETRVETVTDKTADPTPEVSTTTVAVQQQEIQPTTTIALPETTTNTVTDQQPAKVPDHPAVVPNPNTVTTLYQGDAEAVSHPPTNTPENTTTTDPTYHVDPQAPDGYQGPTDPHPDYQMPPQNPDTTTTTQPPVANS